MLARRWLTRLNRAEEKAGPQDIGDARVGYRFSVFTWAVPVVHRSGDRRHSSVWILAGLLARALGVQIPKVLARSKLHIDRQGNPMQQEPATLCRQRQAPHLPLEKRRKWSKRCCVRPRTLRGDEQS